MKGFHSSSTVTSVFNRVLGLLIAFVLSGPTAMVRSGEVDIGSGVSTAVKKAVPFLQDHGVAWMEERGCVSCHQIPFMVWSLSAAKQHGYSIDQDKLDDWQTWSTKVENFVKPEEKATLDVEKTLASNIDTMNALLLAMPGASGNQAERGEKTINETGMSWRQDFAAALIDNQQADGAWKACGQLPAQKRPKIETTQVTVLWSMLSLAKSGNADYNQEAARQVIINDNPVSTEWWVARLLLAQQLADGQTKDLQARLLSHQNEDGGWGWLTEDASDALGTGMALYALRHSGCPDDEAMGRAEHFLVTTQRDNGSWAVNGTKKAKRGKSTETSDYWGTAWSVIALLE